MDYRDPAVKPWRMTLHAVVVTLLGAGVAIGMFTDQHPLALILAVLFVGYQIEDAIETGVGDIKRQNAPTRITYTGRWS